MYFGAESYIIKYNSLKTISRIFNTKKQNQFRPKNLVYIEGKYSANRNRKSWRRAGSTDAMALELLLSTIFLPPNRFPSPSGTTYLHSPTL